MIKNLQDDQDLWPTFWESFGKNIKMGVVEDTTNRTALSAICNFQTSHAEGVNDSLTTLDGYVSRMKTTQKEIYYYATSNSKKAIESPFVEKLVKKGFEVLLLTDPLDEYVMMN